MLISPVIEIPTLVIPYIWCQPRTVHSSHCQQIPLFIQLKMFLTAAGLLQHWEALGSTLCLPLVFIELLSNVTILFDVFHFTFVTYVQQPSPCLLKKFSGCQSYYIKELTWTPLILDCPFNSYCQLDKIWNNLWGISLVMPARCFFPEMFNWRRKTHLGCGAIIQMGIPKCL